ncbi:hypothetical protein [Janthinobacterium sp. CAN_S7]|uniref:hypothetical protein n=1 Tax=Janthinobacterium sp. CAN_S7 TaxID=3071704 RepID=UPI00319DE1F3
MKVKNGTVERNIYVETRGRSLRFRVEVSPLPKDDITVDFDQYEAGLQWARRRRVELLEQKAQSKKHAAPAVAMAAPVVAGWSPAEIRVSEVFESFRVRELPHLSGAAADSSRLKGLEEWFGQLTLGELTYDLLQKWMVDRASGVLGPGRISYPHGYSKNLRVQIRKAIAAGKEFLSDGKTLAVMPDPIIVPPLAQTIRHEMTLLRRALHAYFSAHGLNEKHGTWLECQQVMQIDLPEKPDPRHTRVDEDGLQALVKELNDSALAAFTQFAVMTTLRRSEVCSLRWEELCLSLLLNRRAVIYEAVGGKPVKSHKRVRDVIARIMSSDLDDEMRRALMRQLEKFGLRPLWKSTTNQWNLVVAASEMNGGLRRLMQGTPWSSGGWKDVLSRVPAAVMGQQRVDGMSQKVVELCLTEDLISPESGDEYELPEAA